MLVEPLVSSLARSRWAAFAGFSFSVSPVPHGRDSGLELAAGARPPRPRDRLLCLPPGKKAGLVREEPAATATIVALAVIVEGEREARGDRTDRSIDR